MNSSASLTETICADTIRYYENNIQNPINYGLECYLGEAYLNCEGAYPGSKQEIHRSIVKLLSEAQVFNKCSFWGWEKSPSIPGVTFPLDWDDTSKAIDFIRLANKSGYVTNDELSAMNLPSNTIWNDLIESSLFHRIEIGEDTLVQCPFHDSLTVFFGPGAEKLKMRDDSMVSIVTIRTTYNWYYDVYVGLHTEMISILNRGIFTLNKILETKNLNFSSISRYYYSFGHYAFRLIETIHLIKHEGLLISINFRLLNSIIDQSYTKISLGKSENVEDFWLFLVGIKLKLFHFSGDTFLLNLNKIDDDAPIFRHRRLNHYYGSKHWHKRMLYYEYKSLIKL